MIFFRNLFLLCTACLMAVAFIHASIAEVVSDKVICAVKIESDKSPVIDGRLDDECWGKADKVSDFTQTESTMDDTQSLFLLYGWEYRPESHFFVVYTDNKERSEDAERIMFVKFSYLLKWNIF